MAETKPCFCKKILIPVFCKISFLCSRKETFLAAEIPATSATQNGARADKILFSQQGIILSLNISTQHDSILNLYLYIIEEKKFCFSLDACFFFHDPSPQSNIT